MSNAHSRKTDGLPTRVGAPGRLVHFAPDRVDRRAGELGQAAAGVGAERLDELALRLVPMVSNTRDDLPLPLTPVKATSRCFGTSTSMP